MSFYNSVYPKDSDWMINSVDPDKTAPSHCMSIVILVYTVCPGLYVKKTQDNYSKQRLGCT